MRTPKLFSSKFVKLIKAWNEEEIKSFELWLRSPWCNSNKNLIRLMDRMKKYHPDFNDSKVTKEKLFAKILPNGKYSDRRMNNILSEAYLAAEKFMVFQRFEKEQSLQKDLLTQEFQSRYLDDWFFRDIQKEIDRLEKKEVKDWEDHLDLFRMYRRVYHHPDANTRMSEEGAYHFTGMNDQIKVIFLLEKAALINEKLFRTKILKSENHDVEFEKQNWLELSTGVLHPSIELYQLRFSYNEKNILIVYQKLREKVITFFSLLNEREQKTHLISIINDTSKLINQGKIDFTEFLPFYQLGLKTKVLFIQGKLTRNTYATIVMASNTKGTFSYTKKFIKEYTQYLDILIQLDCYNWANAHTAYWESELEKCIEILQMYDFKVPYFQLITRVLNTQAFFDLFLSDDSYQFYLFNFFDTFEKWLNREKVWSINVKKSFLRFVQICRQLSKAFIENDYQEEKLRNILKGEDSVQAFSWLTLKRDFILEKRKKR